MEKYSIELNKIHHVDNRIGMAGLPDKSVNLIISDPPYFEVKGDFDFVWTSFDEYLEFMEEQARHYKRVLADNGTLFVYGHAKKVAYVQVIFDKYFNLENNLVWRKGECQTMRAEIAAMRTYAAITERILMYSNEIVNINGLCVNNIREYIREEILRARGKISFKDINTALGTATNGGGVASACLSLDKTEPAMITEEHYLKLRRWLNSSGDEFLRKDYEDLRRPFFNNGVLQYDVLDYSQETHITKNFEHDTKKPETLTRALILTCSRPNDLVLAPFAGSGTECAMAVKEGRRYVGFDTNEKYVKMANDRCEILKQQQTLFRA